jgi:hypothetical protein
MKRFEVLALFLRFGLCDKIASFARAVHKHRIFMLLKLHSVAF